MIIVDGKKYIAADKNQFAGSHGISNAEQHMQIRRYGYEICPVPLPFGDYCLLTDQMTETIKRRENRLKKADFVGDIKVSVDTKANMDEVAMNIQSPSHNRFRDEAILAQKCGCKLCVLICDERIRGINDVASWKSKRKKSKVNPESLMKAMKTMSEKYGIYWYFCKRESIGRAIIYLLTGDDMGA